MSALIFLGFASGLPLYLTSQTLQAWMTKDNVDLAAIGLFSLVGIPYSFKFIWSPLLDRFVPPFLGRRRGWLVITQVGLVLAIAGMALQDPDKALTLLAINALFIAIFSATQDIAADAYRTDVLEEPEMGAGVAVFVLGYRLALLTTGSLALILADRMPWPQVYALLALLMLIGIIASYFAPEPIVQSPPPDSLRSAIVDPFIDFFQRKGLLTGIMILVFIVLYKLGDAIANNMSTPFLLQAGFTQTDIGAIKGGMGLIATIVGTLAGGVFLSKLGINRSLWIFGGFQALSNLAYLALANVGKSYPFMILTINIENFCAGLGTAAFLAFFMSLCNKQFSATQYALLSSLYAFSQNILIAPAGLIAKETGWPLFFLLSFLISFPGLALLPIFAPWNGNDRAKLAMPRPGLEDEDLK
ncbi:MAG: AmpG family muropeptide MFS transporter [Snowella sp.]|nr:AmpG family muropeptide MFS transporter [Snowella sp.]